MHRTDKYSKHSSIIWPVWKHLHVVRSAGLGKIFCNFGNNPMVLLILFDKFFKCPSHVNLLSKVYFIHIIMFLQRYLRNIAIVET